MPYSHKPTYLRKFSDNLAKKNSKKVSICYVPSLPPKYTTSNNE